MGVNKIILGGRGNLNELNYNNEYFEIIGGSLNLVCAFGEMYVKETNPLLITFTLANTFYQIKNVELGDFENIDANNITGNFTILKNGSYKFSGVSSIKPNQGCEINFAVFKNGLKISKIETVLEFQNNQDENTFSGTGILKNLNVGDIITVKGKSTTANTILTIKHLNMSLFRYC